MMEGQYINLQDEGEINAVIPVAFIVGLRHDIDTMLGLSRGVPAVMRLEEQMNVRSSFYVRVRLLHDEDLINMLRRAERDGWEIGLHLDNTFSLADARRELEALRSLGFNVRGVTIHGGLYGMLGEVTWRVIDGLGLAYAHAGGPPDWVKTPVIPGHHTLDYYVGRYGEHEGMRRLIRGIISDLRGSKASVLSSHPEYFVVSAGTMPVVESRLSPRIRVAKILRKMLIAFYTMLGRNRVAPIYRELLGILGEHVALKPLIDVCRVLYSSSCPA